jgi:alcohol dehydrogenase class IV
MGSAESPPQRFLGEGTLGRVADLLGLQQARRALLVTGRESYSLSGAERALSPMLRGLDVTRFHDFETNPILPDVERGVRLCRDVRPDIVIAVGGGSVIDMAKAINVLAVQDGSPADVLLHAAPIRGRGRPMIAVPTTAGSGSEATHFATIYADGVKHSLTHGSLLPDYAIVDPRLTSALPPQLTAITGLDALAQAIESYWAVGATPGSQALAAEAIDLMWKTLRVAVAVPTPAARADMALGAHLAGRAIDVSRTTAAHAISYPLTKRYGVPHGHAVALTLAAWFEHNAKAARSSVNDARGPGYVERTMSELCRRLGCPTPVAAAEAWRNLVHSVGLATDLRGAGVSRDVVEGLVEEVNAERLGNHPVQVTRGDLREILTALLCG